MKEGWKVVKLGDVCEASNGLWKGKKPPYKKIAVIRNTNFSKDCKLKLDNVEYIDVEERQYISRKLEYGDIILEKSGGSDKQPVGRPVLFNVIEGDFSYSNFTSRLRINDFGSVDSHYLHKVLYHLYLEGATFNLQSNTTGIHNLDLKGYLELEIPLPPLPEQHRIVKKLDAAFEKIDAMKAKAEKNIENAKALFQQTLAEELEPKEGWVEKKIKDIGEVVGGTTPNTSNKEFWNGDRCWISPAELHGEHYLYDSARKITELAVKSKNLKELPVGTVILSSRAPIGKVAINKVPMYCNQGFKCVVCGDSIYNEFLYWWFYGKTEYLNTLGTGATFLEISKTIVENIGISIPSLIEQQQIVTKLDNLSAKCKKLEEAERKTIAECDALKQAILRQAFNGEL